MVGHGLSVVSGRDRDDAALAFGLVQRKQLEKRAALFETARRLHALVFQENLRAATAPKAWAPRRPGVRMMAPFSLSAAARIVGSQAPAFAGVEACVSREPSATAPALCPRSPRSMRVLCPCRRRKSERRPVTLNRPAARWSRWWRGLRDRGAPAPHPPSDRFS